MRETAPPLLRQPTLLSEPLASKNLRELSCWVYNGGTDERVSLLRKRVRFVARCLMYYPSFKALIAFFDQHELQFIVEKHPRLLEKIFRPYLYKTVDQKMRVQFMCQHYYFMQEKHDKAILERIYGGTGLTLFSFNIEIDEDHTRVFNLVLHYHKQFEKEGELLLVLEQDGGERIYSVAFTIIGEKEQFEVIMGGFQGPSALIAERELIVRKLTRRLFGLRPKALMVEVMSMLASHLGCQRLLAVTLQGHVYQRIKNRRSRIKSDYDTFWMECQGEVQDENFIRLPLPMERKPMELIKSKKRSSYRQRYEWLDTVKRTIGDMLR